MVRRAHLVKTGARRTRVTGVGREFAALRDYTPDDEFRVIDWKATARRGKVTSRTFEAERSQDVLLLIDLGRLMRQEVAHTQKLDHVVSAALMLAHVAAEADDRVGLLTFADEALRLAAAAPGPRPGDRHPPRPLRRPRRALESDYRAAFPFLAARWRKRSLAVLFTDVADPESSAVLLAEIAQARVRAPGRLRARARPAGIARAADARGRRPGLRESRRRGGPCRPAARAGYTIRRGVLLVDAEPQELSAELVARYLTVKSRALL